LDQLSRENGDLRRQLEVANAALRASDDRAALLGNETAQPPPSAHNPQAPR
jgi:hypothetical protein